MSKHSAHPNYQGVLLMGIFTQIREPVARRPVHLPILPTVDGSGSDWPDAGSSVPNIIKIHLSVDTAAPCPGSEVFIFGQGSGELGAWVREPHTRCLGPVVEEHMKIAADLCQRRRRGLRGEVLGKPDNGVIQIQVRVAVEVTG